MGYSIMTLKVDSSIFWNKIRSRTGLKTISTSVHDISHVNSIVDEKKLDLFCSSLTSSPSGQSIEILFKPKGQITEERFLDHLKKFEDYIMSKD